MTTLKLCLIFCFTLFCNFFSQSMERFAERFSSTCPSESDVSPRDRSLRTRTSRLERFRAAGKLKKKLFQACSIGSLEVVRKIFRAGDEFFDARDECGNTVFHKAASLGHLKIVRYFVQELIFNLEDINSQGLTPIYLAVQDFKFDVVKYLKSQGAMFDVNKKFLPGRATIAHKAAMCANKTDFAFLIRRLGAKMNIKNALGQTPFFLAANYGKIENVVILLKLKVVDYSEDCRGLNAAEAAALAGYFKVARFLVERFDFTFDTRKRDSCRATVLHKVAKKRDMRYLKYFMSKRADVNAVDKEGFTPLHRLIFRHSDAGFDMGKILIESGARLDISDSEGNTVLHLAAFFDGANFIEFMIKSGADIWARNREGKIPLEIAEGRYELDRHEDRHEGWIASIQWLRMARDGVTLDD